MKLEEAVSIINEEYPKYKLLSVVDYDNYFIFNIVPPDYDVDRYGEWFGGLVAVDKLFKLSMHFIPLEHDPVAYNKAVETNITYF